MALPQGASYDILLDQKANQLNSLGYDGRKDWTMNQVIAEFRKANLTPQQHYKLWGRHEGIEPK